ncbi:LLM class flavin-dependent oxidoreductase [Roseomonas indoligenes]|uniref:LLM class flavin-dependent oxidoreductase n=1 Tax=Roseomonas indoligenes TaxID=2820811 RepID=A0A940N598_9PROT|nr:LLM class flavin-dependent oxidoreductase [Pararoseomonas indoligenes]MBP0494407.1 LLM class flavin-dependent oxidoreductase [Pararoseomonas indoligenes]
MPMNKMVLAANANAAGSHVGEWRHPDAWDHPAANIRNAVRLAQIAEAGKFDLLFLADGNGVRQLDKPDLFRATSPSDRPGVFEPVTLLSALAMATRHIGLVATATTTYDEPFHVARRFASLDHISGGRAGWNLVTTSNPEDALNFSHSEHVARDTRYARAGEFAAVVKGLWDSWADDAFPQDKASGTFLRPEKVHMLDHAGEHFRVRGPLNAPRSPQGHPVIFSAGQSETGKDLSAQHADCVFAIEGNLANAQRLYADIKGRLPKFGRAADAMRILAGVTIFVGETEAEADALFQELEDLVPPAVGVDYLSKMLGRSMRDLPLDEPMPELDEEHVGHTGIGKAILRVAREEGLTVRQTYQRILPQMGGNMFKGDARRIADIMEEWFTTGGCDGFMIAAPVVPTGLERFIRLVVPELRRRGLFREEYEGPTLRDNLGLARPANPFFPS